MRIKKSMVGGSRKLGERQGTGSRGPAPLSGLVGPKLVPLRRTRRSRQWAFSGAGVACEGGEGGGVGRERGPWYTRMSSEGRGRPRYLGTYDRQPFDPPVSGAVARWRGCL